MGSNSWKIIALAGLCANMMKLLNLGEFSTTYTYTVCIGGVISFITWIYLHKKPDQRGGGPERQQLTIKGEEGKLNDDASFLPRNFSYQDLEIATNDFQVKLSNSATVFEGFLKDGTPVAVRRFEPEKYGEWEFQRELSTSSRVNHDHLIRLRGYCCHQIQTRRLFFSVYDLFPNGSLDNWIFSSISSENDQCLSWTSRYQIAIDVAGAIAYLHTFRPQILHLGIKPENILINNEFRGVLSDFGFSKLMSKDIGRVQTIRGMDWYRAPEWASASKKSEKSDIFSFGKVLLDLLFGQQYVCLDREGNNIYTDDGTSRQEQQIFLQFMLETLKQKKVVNLVDKRLQKEVVEQEVISLVWAALWCLQEEPVERPANMKQMVELLDLKKPDEATISAKCALLCLQDHKKTTFVMGQEVVDMLDENTLNEASFIVPVDLLVEEEEVSGPMVTRQEKGVINVVKLDETDFSPPHDKPREAQTDVLEKADRLNKEKRPDGLGNNLHVALALRRKETCRTSFGQNIMTGHLLPAQKDKSLESKVLEVKGISVSNLQEKKKWGTLKVFVRVHLSNNPDDNKETPTNTEGSQNPTWNDAVQMKFRLTDSALEQNDLSLKFQIFRTKHISKHKQIGEVVVPISELVHDSDSEGIEGHPLTKDISSSGTLTFRYRIREPIGEADGATPGCNSTSQPPPKSERKREIFKPIVKKTGRKVVSAMEDYAAEAAIAIGMGYLLHDQMEKTGEDPANDEEQK